jgi:hypothetical protein
MQISVHKIQSFPSITIAPKLPTATNLLDVVRQNGTTSNNFCVGFMFTTIIAYVLTLHSCFRSEISIVIDSSILSNRERLIETSVLVSTSHEADSPAIQHHDYVNKIDLWGISHLA